MALGKSAAVVIGSFDLGESDRVITFYSREYGKVRGVAKASRRMRSLRALTGAATPPRVTVCFGARALDVLGHRPRLDRCVECARAYPFARPSLDEGGVVCEPCAAQAPGATPISPAAVAALGRLRA